MTSVSIIVPCFQAHETIERCVSSFFSDGAPKGEVEVILESDDGSDYDWIARKFPNVRSYTAGVVGSGPGPTRNRGLGRATGEWVTFVDSDDWVGPQYSDKMLATCLSHGAAVSRSHVVENGDRIGSFGPGLAHLDLGEWAKSGISMRGMFARQRCPAHHDRPSQDIFHLVEAILQTAAGRIRISDADYTMRVRSHSVTTGENFSDRVGQAYDAYIDIIRSQYRDNAHAGDAVAFFAAKKAINASYSANGASTSFYRFLFDDILKARAERL